MIDSWISRTTEIRKPVFADGAENINLRQLTVFTGYLLPSIYSIRVIVEYFIMIMFRSFRYNYILF